MKTYFKILYGLAFLSMQLMGSQASAQSFDLIPLGVYGGGDESNLSAYLIGEKDSQAYLSLDAGTIRAGIDKAIDNGVFQTDNLDVLRNYIKGYFISHGHLDHLAGMLINAPDDSKKPIYALPFTIDILKTRYFTNTSWANFADEGDAPQLGILSYQRKSDGEEFAIQNTSLKARIFELSHIEPYKSSALLVIHPNGDSVLYFGDTGADRIEGAGKLNRIWEEVAPLVRDGSLKAILIETSFDNDRDEKLLFGHLTPRLLNEELTHLSQKVGNKDLKGLKVFITHLKPGGEQVQKIKSQLEKDNPMKVEFVFLQQGVKYEL